MKVNINSDKILHNSSYAITSVAKKIREGEVVCFPTETVYALSCDAYNIDAIRKINSMKMRKENQALSILVKDIKQIDELAVLTPEAIKIIRKYSPGPVTYIVKRKTNCKIPTIINPNSDTIGIRIPDHPVAQAILAELNQPVIGTSTNISSQKDATNIEEIDKQILNQLSLVIDGGKSLYSTGSTILDITDPFQVKVIRHGAIGYPK